MLEGDDGSLRYTLPLLLRVVNANWRVGKAEHAEALAGLAGNRDVHWLLRGESLKRLTEWDVEARLDPLLGVFRPFSSNPLEPGRKAALAVYEGLLQSERDDLLQATMALVGHYEIKEAAPVLARLARLDPPAVKSRIEKTLREGERLEKQAALQLVSELGTPEAEALLLELMDQLQEKTLDPAIQLDVVEACRASKVPEIEARAARFEEQADQWDDFGLYRTAIDGGSEGTGRAIFFFNSGADCKRCHVINGVGGGMVGPDLSEEKLVLEQDISFYEFDSKDGLEPHSVGDVVAEEVPAPLTEEVVIQKQYIRSRRSSQSGMPEDVVDSLQLTLLRDLIAFLASKEE